MIRISEWDCVRFIDRAGRAIPELFTGTMEAATNRINLLRHTYPNLNGTGIVIGIREDRFDTADVDLRGRYLVNPAATPSNNSHASIMSTLTAGGNSWHATRGPAWGAKLVSSPFTNLFPDPASFFQQYGVSVQNHSYGTAIENHYGPEALAYDQFVFAEPSRVHVFSSGNSGTQTPSGGIYAGIPGFANLTGQFKMAKNCIAVGATDSLRILSVISSRGPAHDGRIKPELVALGEDGSSGAAALTSGVAATLQQAYRAINAGMLPPASLVKALLINGADDAGSPGPDHATGFGSLNAFRSMQALSDGSYSIGTVAAGQVQIIPLVIPTGIRGLKITLTWTDPPAAVNASRALVNDLDLDLSFPSGGQTWLPWVLSTFPHPDSLRRPAQRGRDALNNVEQITLTDPAPGTYWVRVSGTTVTNAPQLYSLVWRLDTAGRFEWHHPRRNDPLLAGAVKLLRWQSNLPANTGTIQFSTDGGANWQTITTSSDLSLGYFRWNMPRIFSACQLRMIAGGNYDSDTVIISEPLRLNVGFNCADSFRLQWSPLPPATAYTLYRLGPQYLEPLRVITDTAIVFQKRTEAATVFAVSAVRDGRESVRSFAVDYRYQGLDCYIRSFYADRSGATARVRLELGSRYNIRRILLVRMAGGDSTVINTVNDPAALDYSFFDTRLRTGLTAFRVILELADGSRISSNRASLIHAAEDRLFVFPNPVRRGVPVSVVLNDLQNGTLQVLDGSGRLLFRREIRDGGQELIPTDRLAAGVYLLVLKGHESFVQAARFVVY